MEENYHQRYYAEHKERMKQQIVEARKRRQQTIPVRPVASSLKLTCREREILVLVAQGRLNKEIAAQLHLAIGTVKANINRLYSKLQARNRVEAVRWAMRQGLVD